MLETYEWKNTKQLTNLKFLLAVFIPSSLAFFVFHFILPNLVKNGVPILIAWSTLASIVLLLFVIYAIILLHKEASQLNITIWQRMCFKKVSGKQWLMYLGIMIIGMILISGTQKIIPPIINALHFTIPNYMPFFLNPSIDPLKSDMDVISPGLNIHGKYVLILLMAFTLLLNILAEELYFRAWMLPKLSRFGKLSWVINGILFALYHTFQLWLFPVLLVGSLMFAFIFYHSKSIWPSLMGHFIGNFLLTILGIITLIVR